MDIMSQKLINYEEARRPIPGGRSEGVAERGTWYYK